MVTSVTSLGRNGLYDWLIQRFTAVILGVYTLVMIGFFLAYPDLDYRTWSAFMGSLPMAIANTLVLVSILLHAWIGLWTVMTDYLTSLQLGGAATAVRLIAQAVVALALLAFLLWGLAMIWGGAQ